MKRIIFICTAILMLQGHTLFAAEGDLFRISAGPTLMYDAFNQEVGTGGYLTVGYRLNPSIELELYGATSSHFEVDNDLTHGDASVSMVTMGGRYMSTMSDKSVGFISMGVGVLELDAEETFEGGDDKRSGGVARFGVGVDVPLTDHLGVTCGAGFNRGFGATDEVILFDLTTSLFCTF